MRLLPPIVLTSVEFKRVSYKVVLDYSGIVVRVSLQFMRVRLAREEGRLSKAKPVKVKEC